MKMRSIHRLKKNSEYYYIFQEIILSIKQRNFLAKNASIAFFALFAFIPLVLLILFFFSQWLSSSTLALNKLQAIVPLLLPEMSERIMEEVAKVSSSKTSLGFVWIAILFLGSTPLTSALRSSFNQIFSLGYRDTFFKDKVTDILAVTLIMILLFVYLSINIYLIQASNFFINYVPVIEEKFLISFLSFALFTVVFFFFFFIFIRIWR